MKSTQHNDWRNDHRTAAASPAEDTSVAFSLDAQRARDDAAATTSPAPRSADDDRGPSSGLIDLAALRTAEQSGRSPVLDVLPIFPFGEPPAPDAPASTASPALDAASPAPSAGATRRLGRAHQGAALLAAAAAAVAALTVGFSSPRAALGPPAATGIGAAVSSIEVRLPRLEAPAAAPAELAQVELPAERAVPTEEPGATASPRAPVGRSRASGAAAPQPSRSGTPAQGDTGRRAPADPCGGDLMCAMRRATGG
ncbi:hypothetical protein SOCE26_036530 [Sorangium cellulosum]|uniref:Uncharacterized protein n=1 Tax=Sorangium cellulosum TaxID=56 RepID=A0A2L0ESF1_SORCE|nr:hypothetical protein [Sorangium cellulosum]AUX42226.1 hypothetical protein SOCE26_036530 [Sorangium cellulosum]